MSLRNQDSRSEKLVHEFLKKYLYSSLASKNNIQYIDENNKARQLMGIDFYLKQNQIIKTYDEKAASHYSEKPIPTFAFELSFLNNNQERKGWFVNSNLLTDYYTIIWPKSVSKNIETINDIENAYTLFIDKAKLKEEIAKTYRLDDERLWSINEVIRRFIKNKTEEQGCERIFFKLDESSYDYITQIKDMKEKSKLDLYFCYTSTLEEKPVNLIIYRNYFQKIAKYGYYVDTNGYQLLLLDGKNIETSGKNKLWL